MISYLKTKNMNFKQAEEEWHKQWVEEKPCSFYTFFNNLEKLTEILQKKKQNQDDIDNALISAAEADQLINPFSHSRRVQPSTDINDEVNYDENYKMAEILIKYGANVNFQDYCGDY